MSLHRHSLNCRLSPLKSEERSERKKVRAFFVLQTNTISDIFHEPFFPVLKVMKHGCAEKSLQIMTSFAKMVVSLLNFFPL